MDWHSGARAVVSIEKVEGGVALAVVLACRTPVVLVVRPELLPHCHVSRVVVVRNFQVAWCHGRVRFILDTPSALGEPMVIFQPHLDCATPISTVELFSGLGGWHEGMRVAQKCTRALIDFDHQVSAAMAHRLKTDVLSPSAFYGKAVAGSVGGPAVVCASVSDKLVVQGIGLLNTVVALASPPCQPWSASGNGEGLAGPNGQAFRQLFADGADLGLWALAVENVPGIVKHKDFAALKAYAAEQGFHLACESLVNVDSVHPISRERWIAVWCRRDKLADADSLRIAGQMCWKQPFVAEPTFQLSLATENAALRRLSSADLSFLIPDAEALEFLGRPDLLPSRDGGGKFFHPSQVIKARTRLLTQPIVAAMASYGKQHKLPIQLLMRKGLTTHLLEVDGHVRYYHPFEVLAAMGFPPETVLAKDFFDAHRQAGNALTIGHAVLGIAKVDAVLGSLSPFRPMHDLSELALKIEQHRTGLSAFQVTVQGDFMVLTPVDELESFVPTPSKRPRVEDSTVIPPTVPFGVLEPAATSALPFEPEFVMAHQLELSAGSVGHTCSGGIIFLAHKEGHWMMICHGAPRESLSAFVQRGLPHAKREHFIAFWDDCTEAFWDDEILACPAKKITFEPVKYSVKCSYDENNGCTFRADVTSTVRGAIAATATAIQCNPESLALLHNDTPLKYDDFLSELEVGALQIKFRMISPAHSTPQIGQGQEDQGLRPVDCSCARVFARHPNRKVLRSGMVTMKDTCAEAVRILMPDVAAAVSWRIVVKGRYLDEQTPIEILLRDQISSFEIEWDTMAPWRVTCVNLMTSHYALGSSLYHQLHPGVACIQRWIKSPFRGKAEVVSLPGDVAIGQLAASYLAHTRINTSVLCLLGGSVADPLMAFQDVPELEVIAFRLCPLRGGAKKGPLDDALSAALEGHGVPRDQLQSRLKLFKDRCDIGDLKDCLDDDSKLWSRMKSLANDGRVRLVTAAELNEWKKKNNGGVKPNSKPPSQAANRPAKRGRVQEQEISPDGIEVSPTHFVVDGEAPGFLHRDRFGTDEEGLCIMSAHETRICLQQKIRSSGGLAILVVGKQANTFDNCITVPAHWKKTGEPLVLRSALVNFGDKSIEFQPQVPVLEVPQVVATVVEFCILRKHTASWSETALPLNYLGKHVTVLRGPNLLSYWALKTFGDDRKPAAHSKATSWRGFFKVADTLLDNVLAKSGIAGIFMTPKGDDHKADARYVPIPITTGTLDDAWNKSVGCEHALGVALWGDRFAVRCRREHADQVRKVIAPDAAYIDCPAVDPQADLYVLRHVPGQPSRDQLSQALVASGWEAQVIRPQGQATWIVAAKNPPKTQHVGLNGSLVIIEPLRKAKSPSLTLVARHVQMGVQMQFDESGRVAQASAVSRMAEVKCEIQAQIAAEVGAQLRQAHDKMDKLNDTVLALQKANEDKINATAQSVEHMREEASFTKQKLHELEKSNAATTQTLVASMERLMGQMEKNMNSKLDTIKSDVVGRLAEVEESVGMGKRARKETDGAL